MFVSTEYQRKELWGNKLPAVITALLSVLQMILTVVIVGCEIGGTFVQFPRMNIFVGYWTLPLFMCAWISLAGAGCCCRIRCCGIAVLVFQCLAVPMACDCSSYIYSSYSSYYYSYYNTTVSDYYGLSNTTLLYSIKVPLTKGQLSAGVLMLVSSVIYIIIFAVTNYRVQKAIGYQNGPPVPVAIVPSPAQYVS